MSEKMDRRSFLQKGAIIGASSVVGGKILSALVLKNSNVLYGDEKVDISVVKGEDYFESTIRAVEEFGGMKRFVTKNSRVAILPNAQRNNPGTYTKPDVVRAVVRMCKKAGAKEINCLSWLPEKNWEDTGLAKAVKKEGANLVLVNRNDESLFKPVPVKKGKALKEARIMKEFFKNDVFITLPVTKDHAGNKFTGTLKNMMGLNSPQNNRGFHKEDWDTNIDSIRFLDQCIADLNTIIEPDLCIVDATEFITTNGPFGPGKLLKPQKVVAGIDRVAIDAYCCQLWGLKPDSIIAINKAYEHELGEMSLKKVNIKELEV
ncbi:MAG: DUF362 domain-containing protein [Gemmatimonadota bacterium]|nr:MAG: DUF362 domain-containing protein [Gemmatimonadota bacterium]